MSICTFKYIYLYLINKHKTRFSSINLTTKLINKISNYNNKYVFYKNLHEEKSIFIHNKLLLKLFEQSQKIFFILNYNIYKYKTSLFISNNKYDLNYDEIFFDNDNNIHNNDKVFKLYYNKVTYNFTINDIVMLIKHNIYNYEELNNNDDKPLSIIIDPKYIKNPYTNIDFNIKDYYNIYIFLKKK